MGEKFRRQLENGVSGNGLAARYAGAARPRVNIKIRSRSGGGEKK